ncbi:hypothetical protein [Spirosoma sp. 209]|uniref:hypothetical protein n=1 Tax=Spirosoma sp. 209 TaxID=1955701 RepID=UPI00098D332A|nr:hypothetical protein [Spirosoma sp. 209]
MVTVWISVSLLALTGWQGYRLGREYGWWGRATVPTAPKNDREVSANPLPDSPVTTGEGLGLSKTNFNRLLVGYAPEQVSGTELPQRGSKPMCNETAPELEEDVPVTEPATTLNGMTDTKPTDDYPEETDQVPTGCSWMDDEDVPLIDGTTQEETIETGGVPVTEYIKRVRTVQRKMNQLTQRRQADSTFMKQELGLLIQTYQLENDKSLDWLFLQQGPKVGTDYGTLFDRIESLAA